MVGGKDRARHYRYNSTLPEALLWNRLEHDQLGFQFRRQDVSDQFILDFYCPDLMVDIEVDGKIHALKADRDEAREKYLQSKGVTVIRYSAKSVLQDPDIVAFQIKCKLQQMVQRLDTSSDGEVGEERTG